MLICANSDDRGLFGPIHQQVSGNSRRMSHSYLPTTRKSADAYNSKQGTRRIEQATFTSGNTRLLRIPIWGFCAISGVAIRWGAEGCDAITRWKYGSGSRLHRMRIVPDGRVLLVAGSMAVSYWLSGWILGSQEASAYSALAPQRSWRRLRSSIFEGLQLRYWYVDVWALRQRLLVALRSAASCNGFVSWGGSEIFSGTTDTMHQQTRVRRSDYSWDLSVEDRRTSSKKAIEIV
ncbi:hypothetical protein ABW21_db0200092 [Orbilia brochopaga]|nr:hypothetical protein ABW21_db0200092 [Drechslerella brochopaga]